MDNRVFASYGYQLDGTMNRLGCAVILSVFSAIACTAFFHTPWFLMLLLVPPGILVYIKRSGCSKPLLISSRYLILGERIIYFGTVTRASLDKENQTLTISTEKGRSLTIAADKFPTNARKPDKIRINKSAKFDKVSERIIASLRAASPDIEIT
jgi:hypothetical protein